MSYIHSYNIFSLWTKLQYRQYSPIVIVIRVEHIPLLQVECLLVNRTVFTKHDNGRDLIILRQELMSNIPSRKEAFKSYIKERNWRKYRKFLVGDLIKRRCKQVSTTYEDVPDIIRRRHEHYVRKLQKTVKPKTILKFSVNKTVPFYLRYTN